MSRPVAILHLDESCLGNGREGENPGGGGGLIEARSAQREDPAARLLHPRAGHDQQPDGARGRRSRALQLLARKGARLPVLIVSDSQYLVKGMREWVPGWVGAGLEPEGRARSRTSSSGRRSSPRARLHDVQWTWVRGHKGHPKNEYANDLAVLAAREQRTSEGIVESGFDEWLEAKRAKGLYLGLRPGRRVRRAGGAGGLGRAVSLC